MNTRVLPDRLLETLKRNPYVYTAARKARMSAGSVLPPREVPGIPGRVHFNDFMLETDSPTAPNGPTKYARSAQNVIDFIGRGLNEAGRTFDDIDRWLDFGCGYGRVLRMLLQHVDRRRVVVADVIEGGVEFCMREFGVCGMYSTPRVADLALPRVDFVYAISVLTHLPLRDALDLLRVLADTLEDGGILLFTTHGQHRIDNLDPFDISIRSRRDEVRAAVAAEGAAFIPYSHYLGDDLGITWHTPEYIRAAANDISGGTLELMVFEPHGLDEHQDVFIYRKGR